MSSCYLGQLFCDVTSDEHSFKVDPEILNGHPTFYNISRGGELGNPLVDTLLKRRVVSTGEGKMRRCKGTGWDAKNAQGTGSESFTIV